MQNRGTREIASTFRHRHSTLAWLQSLTVAIFVGLIYLNQNTYPDGEMSKAFSERKKENKNFYIRNFKLVDSMSSPLFHCA